MIALRRVSLIESAVEELVGKTASEVRRNYFNNRIEIDGQVVRYNLIRNDKLGFGADEEAMCAIASIGDKESIRRALQIVLSD